MYYTVRFENTGNASAIDVSITDILDSRVDETSIRMESASHNYTLDRIGSLLTWNFRNIQLPVSVVNTDIGKGYVSFKVRLKPGFAIGDIIPNTANIYFDSNPAIETNTFYTEFVTTLGTATHLTGQFSMYPNPANHFVHIETASIQDNIDRIVIYNIIGEKVLNSSQLAAPLHTLDVSALSKGIYLVEITTVSQVKLVKKLVIK